MNVQRITLSNFGSWADADIAIEPGVTLISGRNGAGKSTLLAAIEFALYGATSDAGRLIRRGTDKAAVRVWVATDHGLLIVERTIRRSGAKAVVSLSVWDGDDETNLTAATTTETQERLEVSLGISREVLLASAFSTQHGGAAFTEAQPRDRKRIFGEILALGFWDVLADQARGELKDAKQRAQIAEALIESVNGASERLDGCLGVVDRAKATLDASIQSEYAAALECDLRREEAEAAREARRQHAAAVEAAERTRADHQRATADRATAEEALATAKQAAANAPSVEDAEAEYQAATFAYATAAIDHAAAAKKQTKHREQQAEAELHRAAAASAHARHVEEYEALEIRLTRATAGICNECGQPLISDEAKTLVQRLADALEAANREAEKAEHEARDWNTRVAYLADNAPASPDDAALRVARERDAQSRVKREEAKTIQSLAGSIKAAQQRARDAMDREMETAEQLRLAIIMSKPAPHIDDKAEAKHLAALDVLTRARLAHHQAAADLAGAEAAAQQAERDATAEADARAKLAAAQNDATIAGILAAGFGPTGVPALVIDNILGQLADEANRVLAELGTPIRVDLRSQRATQKGELRDALDIIIVLDGINDAPYETLSGGERTRVALALRAALTRLLAAKSGARVRLLVCDEPSGLDAQGAEAFADVLQSFITASIFDTAIVVTHDERLADRIARVIRVERAPGGESRLATGLATRVATPEAVDA